MYSISRCISYNKNLQNVHMKPFLSWFFFHLLLLLPKVRWNWTSIHINAVLQRIHMHRFKCIQRISGWTHGKMRTRSQMFSNSQKRNCQKNNTHYYTHTHTLNRAWNFSEQKSLIPFLLDMVWVNVQCTNYERTCIALYALLNLYMFSVHFAKISDSIVLEFLIECNGVI